ncbi:LysR family transcriptional regulator [Alphaproteobacteria bacterium]|jgi:molybdate transport repressor ModE-like protein|nr:LysR family transcriptional regulator [Alphaproteobacteria bacterium]MDB9871798.1 LysR family transcriptional regulator [Alphaproteobacteria bacterium]|tara:strand:+ start:438 stop:830 length:393 start_codon:yes stop_codon:yes gene_type:complete
MKNKSIQIKRSSLPPRLVNENENGIRIKVYIQGHMIGAGKMELFHLVAEKGSIRSAAKAMGMSTKRATLLLKTIEEAFPNPILEKQPGNKGTLVTFFGKELLKKYLVLSDHLTKESEEFINWAASKQSVK